MPNHKFYFVANLIHFFGILKYIKRQQLTSITIYYEKLLFPRFFSKDSVRKILIYTKKPEDLPNGKSSDNRFIYSVFIPRMLKPMQE